MGRKRKHIKERYGRLLVLHEDPVVKCKWICQCDCGTVKSIAVSSLRSGRSKSCGCYCSDVLVKIRTTHGQSKTKIYNIWVSMLSRCRNKNFPLYKNYGGRGIKVCERWLIFENFLADMGDKPDGMTIDRINNDGNYEPSNCRWATWIDQANNKRTTRFVVYNGMKLSLAQWARKLNINSDTLKDRLDSNWPIREAFFKPVKRLFKTFINTYSWFKTQFSFRF